MLDKFSTKHCDVTFDLIRDYKAGKLSRLTLENKHTMCACGVMWEDGKEASND